ncbi:MDIS1-interacting receptor like kinase 1 isoform X1 [Selaginella moellendorffii]|nr:MDIS1-interacting receptor like kinase 1 isoform X1 [Selaginella moellendorffii]|eukprot:XP_002969446.2 MDIS1-interacting receptor like kinase 1 isoform X1 [Selaginella moellendorffii]
MEKKKKKNHIQDNVLLAMAFSILLLPARADDPTDEASILKSLAESMDPAKLLQDWWSDPSSGVAASHCQWSGVTCSTAAGPVTSLDLHSKNLSGSLSSHLGRLSSLSFLNLSDNALSGPLPPAIAELSNLTVLDIAVNLFSGELPPGLGSLPRLRFLRAYNNNFSGAIPPALGGASALEHLDLGGSYFDGAIPGELTALQSLRLLRLSGNALTGEIPASIGKLSALQVLQLSYNPFLSGRIPDSIGDLGELRYLSLERCNLSGAIPPSIGNLSRCNTTFLFQNRLSGPLPSSMGAMGELMSLDLSNNSLSGPIPDSFAALHRLTLLNLMINDLSGPLPRFIGDLPSLQVLKIFTNSFTGSLPPGLGSSPGLVWIDASSNRLSGPIPDGICRGGSLVKLEFFANRLTGSIPDLSNCSQLVRVRLHENRLSGPVPREFGSMRGLNKLELADNLLSGEIPDALADAPLLSSIDLSGNRLSGGIPPRLFTVPQLQELFLAGNGLSGVIPRGIGEAMSLQKLDLSDNALSGTIPEEIAGCKRMIAVDLSGNRLSGEIPRAIAELPVLATVDLSRNQLTGAIPRVLEESDTLESFNVSQNELSGQMPTLGIFRTENPSSFSGNPGLCGGILSEQRPCTAGGSDFFSDSAAPGPDSRLNGKTLGWIIALVVATSVGVLAISWRWICGTIATIKQQQQQKQGGDHDLHLNLLEWKLTAFQRLGYTSFDVLECLTDSNVVGKGAAGTVYKAEMKNGEVLAVKKLNTSARKDTAGHVQRGFLAEVNLLGGIRHRNIVRLLGYCSNGDTSLLIYEYMPNGSLSDALHGKAGSVLADWVARYKVAVGIAQGLCYLHHDCFPQIVHRDVKSSNILLDADMEARVADFGVAKLVECSDQPMSVVAGSYGYIPPEYAYTMRVDERGDVYSFGVVLLELLTGKRPVEPEFGDNVNIVEWVRLKILQCNTTSNNPASHKVSNSVLDPSIAAPGSSVEEEMVLVLRIALLCTSKLPRERPSMRDVVTMLSEAMPRRKETSCCQQQQQQQQHSSICNSPE